MRTGVPGSPGPDPGMTGSTVIETLNATAKTNSGVFFRTGDIDGPTFSTTENPPLFEGRIDTSYFATVIS